MRYFATFTLHRSFKQWSLDKCKSFCLFLSLVCFFTKYWLISLAIHKGVRFENCANLHFWIYLQRMVMTQAIFFIFQFSSAHFQELILNKISKHSVRSTFQHNFKPNVSFLSTWLNILCPKIWGTSFQTLYCFLWEQTKTISAGKHSDSSLFISTYQNQLPCQKRKQI